MLLARPACNNLAYVLYPCCNAPEPYLDYLAGGAGALGVGGVAVVGGLVVHLPCGTVTLGLSKLVDQELLGLGAYGPVLGGVALSSLHEHLPLLARALGTHWLSWKTTIK